MYQYFTNFIDCLDIVIIIKLGLFSRLKADTFDKSAYVNLFLWERH